MLARAGDRMHIVCSLPYGSEENPPPVRALVVSKIDFKPSGDDHSFITLELDESVSRGFIVDAFKKLKLQPLSLYTKSGGGHRGNSLHLIEINSFIDDESPVLEKIRAAFGEYCSYCVALGGYPAVPVYKKRKAQKNEAIPAAPKRKKREAKKKTARA
jgi:chorismate mutase / prephenate dehydratase